MRKKLDATLKSIQERGEGLDGFKDEKDEKERSDS